MPAEKAFCLYLKEWSVFCVTGLWWKTPSRKTMEKQKEDSEKIISEISSVLEEMFVFLWWLTGSCGDDDTCFESAPLKYQLACVLIDNVHVLEQNGCYCRIVWTQKSLDTTMKVLIRMIWILLGRILNQVRNGGKHLWYSTVVVHKCRRW